MGRPESLLSKLSPSDWKAISVDIDYVAYVWDDLPLFLSDEWVTKVEDVLNRNRVQIAMFSCGCVLPNEYFEVVKHRLGGFECLLLPGWVFKSDDIHWLQVEEGRQNCMRRDNVVKVKLVKKFKAELDDIERTISKFNQALEKGDENTNEATVDDRTLRNAR